MGLRIDTSNNSYRWATSDYWYNNPVTLTIYNDDNTAARLGGIRLQMISCNAGNHYVEDISSGQAAGQSGTFAIFAADGYTQLSQAVQIQSESRSNVCTVGDSFAADDTWFLPRYTRDYGAQYNTSTYDGTYISEQDYNNAFYTFTFPTPVTIPADSYTEVVLKLSSGWGTWQLSDLINATPLPAYQITYKPNGGNWSGSTSDIVHEVIKGGNDTLPAAPTRNGYNFTGWLPSGAPPTNVQSNHTYTAQWNVANATVNFFRNLGLDDASFGYGDNPVGMIVGVSADPNAINPELVSDPTFSIPRLVDMVTENISEVVDSRTGLAKGYNFLCWRRNDSISRIPSSQAVTDAVDLHGDTVQAGGNVYYAVYRAISGTLKFYQNYSNSDTGIVSGGNQSGGDYITSTLGSRKPTNPTRVGYDFLGWARTRTGTIEANNLSLWDATTGQGIKEFYAIWERRATIWVRENGVWVKKLNVRKYNAAQSTWEEKPPKKRSGSSWVDES